MITPPSLDEQLPFLAERLEARGWQLAVAESLTGGLLGATVAQGPKASRWYRGGVVAYQYPTKQKLLGVSDVPVVSEECATQMAAGVRRLMDAEVGLAVTGVGGPGPEEGQPAGTVWMAVDAHHRRAARLHHLGGLAPGDVLSMSCVLAVELGIDALGEGEGR